MDSNTYHFWLINNDTNIYYCQVTVFNAPEKQNKT